MTSSGPKGGSSRGSGPQVSGGARVGTRAVTHGVSGRGAPKHPSSGRDEWLRVAPRVSAGGPRVGRSGPSVAEPGFWEVRPGAGGDAGRARGVGAGAGRRRAGLPLGGWTSPPRRRRRWPPPRPLRAPARRTRGERSSRRPSRRPRACGPPPPPPPRGGRPVRGGARGAGVSGLRRRGSAWRAADGQAAAAAPPALAPGRGQG